MKTLIAYSSQTGNTRKLAEAIYNVLDGEKELHPVDETPAVDGYDLVALGCWFKAGKPDPAAQKFW